MDALQTKAALANMSQQNILDVIAMLTKRDNSHNTFFNPPSFREYSKRTKARKKAYETLLRKREESFDTGFSPRASNRRMAREMKKRFSELKNKTLSEIVLMMPEQNTQN